MDEDERTLREEIKINPNDAEAHKSLGVLLISLERYEEAIEAYKQAIKIKPDDAVAYLALGFVYFNLGRYEEAIEPYGQAIRLKSDFAKAYFGLGVVYGKLGRYEEAIESYKQAIRLKPDFAAYYNLGVVYGKLSRYEEAIEPYKQAIRIKPDFAEAYFGLGVVYYNLGRYEEAKESFRQAIKIKPDFVEARGFLNELEREISSSKETSSERSSSGCFIATAVYGDENAVELKILRDFRDTVLLTTSLGRLFISLYYFISSSIANIIRKSEYAKNFVKMVLIKPSLLLVMYIINRRDRKERR